MERKITKPLEQTPTKVKTFENDITPSDGYIIIETGVLQELLNSVVSKCPNCDTEKTLVGCPAK